MSQVFDVYQDKILYSSKEKQIYEQYNSTTYKE